MLFAKWEKKKSHGYTVDSQMHYSAFYRREKKYTVATEESFKHSSQFLWIILFLEIAHTQAQKNDDVGLEERMSMISCVLWHVCREQQIHLLWYVYSSESHFCPTESLFSQRKCILREDTEEESESDTTTDWGVGVRVGDLEVREWDKVKQIEEERWKRKETERGDGKWCGPRLLLMAGIGPGKQG